MYECILPKWMIIVRMFDDFAPWRMGGNGAKNKVRLQIQSCDLFPS